MAIVRYGKNGQLDSSRPIDQCVPIFDKCYVDVDPCCPDKCCDVEFPKFKAREALRLKPNEVERFFDLRHYSTGSSLYKYGDTFAIEFISPCDCKWRWRTCANRVTTEGLVVFIWPTAFLRAVSGYWYARILHGNTEVTSFPVYKPFSRAVIDSSYPGECDTFSSPCRADSCCPALQVDDDAYQDSGYCGGCDDR